MNISRKRKVEKVLRAVREKYGVFDRPFTKWDFYRICRAEGIKLARRRRFAAFAEFEAILGCLLWIPARTEAATRIPVIYLRSFFLPSGVDLFAAMHELGHFYFKHESNIALMVKDFDAYQDSVEEKEANEFASLALAEVPNA